VDKSFVVTTRIFDNGFAHLRSLVVLLVKNVISWKYVGSVSSWLYKLGVLREKGQCALWWCIYNILLEPVPLVSLCLCFVLLSIVVS
jgi:hypothetical protein